jgi:hypothetical protein
MTIFTLLRTSLAVTLILMLLGGCNGTSSSSKSKQAEIEARQKAEAQQKAQQAQRESEERRDRLHTLRIVAFVALAGVAVAVIASAGQSAPRSVLDNLPGGPLPLQRPPNLPRLMIGPARPSGEGRVIEMPQQFRTPGAPQPTAAPSAPVRRQRRRRNHQPPRNYRP